MSPLNFNKVIHQSFHDENVSYDLGEELDQYTRNKNVRGNRYRKEYKTIDATFSETTVKTHGSDENVKHFAPERKLDQHKHIHYDENKTVLANKFEKRCVGSCNLKCMTIVLDLDETLIRTFNTDEKVPIPKSHPDYFSFKIGGDLYQGMKRPGLDRFLRKIYKLSSKVIIFTAAQPEYAKNVVDIIFANMHYKPDHIFTYMDCEVGYKRLKKPLDLIMQKFPNEVSLDRTIVFDDKQCVYLSSDIKNVAKVTAFKGEINDNVLYNAYYYIKYLWRKELSVRRIELEKLQL